MVSPFRLRRPARHVARCGAALMVGWLGGGMAEARGGIADRPVTVVAGRLDAGLRRLAAATGWQILFDPALVGDRRMPTVRTGDPAGVLARMLAGSGLKARRLAGGVFIVVAAAPPRPVGVPAIPAAATAAIAGGQRRRDRRHRAQAPHHA